MRWKRRKRNPCLLTSGVHTSAWINHYMGCGSDECGLDVRTSHILGQIFGKSTSCTYFLLPFQGEGGRPLPVLLLLLLLLHLLPLHLLVPHRRGPERIMVDYISFQKGNPICTARNQLLEMDQLFNIINQNSNSNIIFFSQNPLKRHGMFLVILSILVVCSLRIAQEVCCIAIPMTPASSAWSAHWE